MAEQKKGQILILAKNIRGKASGEILEEGKLIRNIACGKFYQTGKKGGVSNDVNRPRKIALKVIKVEGPFDENDRLVDSIEKEKWYTYKAKFNRIPEKKELKALKWATEYNEDGKRLLGNVSNKEKTEIIHKVLLSNNNLRLKIFAFFQTPLAHTKAEIIQGEVLLIVGTEQHSQTYGNKLMFPAQAVREIRENYKNHKHSNIVIFKNAFTNMQLSIIKRDAKKWNVNLYMKQINSVTELVDYINRGDATVNRSRIKISTIKIFSHGLPSILDFGLDGDNEENQRFTVEHVTKLKKESFTSNPEIYSYACRTGNSDGRVVTLNPSYKYDSESIKLVKPENSLAQKLSENLGAKVFAYLRRSNYTPTWLDGGKKEYKSKYITIEDENVSNPLNPKDWFRKGWDEALWNSDGAFLPPKSGDSPGGLLQGGIFIFEKNKEPKQNSKI
ncbi:MULTISPECIES: hypothetical protein [unclassified Chryseobacterium]|uniref:hypothetical protein n=1 Tax=unclassified Chryseobacterium TaxID=2593645 RepID=UPI0021E61FB3|nr:MULTISPECIES: hypothetical protein [unclassified Chryseobacterium]MEA1850767.1 hypothetical protein [Chryseobacterium sp. MHB01]